MGKKNKKKVKIKAETFTAEEFATKHLVVTQHAQDKWIERTNINLGKKRIENYIRACAKEGKLHHYWKDFYIADDIVFIARKKLPTENEVNFPKVKITLSDIIKQNIVISKKITIKERELNKYAEYRCRKYHFNFNTNAKRRSKTTVEKVYAMLQKEDIYQKALSYKRKIIARALFKGRKIKYTNRRLAKARVSQTIKNLYYDANKDLGIVIISVFGSFQDYPCLQDIRTVVMEKERYGRMLY